ncbi:hypothetical protein HAX54_046080, partial [Datura stramonium]|nr:hypothetical protein [Datura stramonium]
MDGPDSGGANSMNVAPGVSMALRISLRPTPFLFSSLCSLLFSKLVVLCGLPPFSLNFSMPMSADDDLEVEEPLGSPPAHVVFFFVTGSGGTTLVGMLSL